MTFTPDDSCGYCGTLYKPAAAFCASCGQQRALVKEPNELAFAFKLYLALLVVNLIAVLYVAHADGDVFKATVIASGAMLFITLAFALARRSVVVPLYTRSGFGLIGYALVLVASPVVLAGVLGYVNGLSKMFGIVQPDEIGVFLPHGWLWTIGLIAILPPLVEELGFRGVIFSGLTRTLTIGEAFIISSFAFALLHLSLPSLITHLPLGLYFCWLRHKSGSLWPAMFAHALHNLGVIAVERFG